MGEFDLNKAKQFVQYWGKPYSYASVKDYNTNEVIDYLDELNFGTLLIENNIKRLLERLGGQVLNYQSLLNQRSNIK